MIRVSDIVHYYDFRPALKKVNLEVEAGEILCLMGPNGMGKSTLLSVMAGAMRPLRGWVEIAGKRRGRSAAEERECRQLVAYLPTRPWLPSSSTGREFLFKVGRIYGVDQERLVEHMESLLELFELREKGDSPISSYSNGQLMKIALCSVLVTEAPVLLLDEPFSGGLDPAGILALKGILAELSRRRKLTVVLATPLPEIAEDLANRIAILREGELVVCGTLDELRRKANVAGSLSDVLAQLFHPETQSKVERYLEKR